MTDLRELAERVAKVDKGDNALDVLVEIALFEPSDHFTAVRSNSAGTKLIYTRQDGVERTHRALDWTMDRQATVAALRALAIVKERLS